MSIRSFMKKLAGRAGKASHSKRGANSHVNTKRNKRASGKALRASHRIKCMHVIDTFAKDFHLDVPDEIYRLADEELDIVQDEEPLRQCYFGKLTKGD